MVVAVSGLELTVSCAGCDDLLNRNECDGADTWYRGRLGEGGVQLDVKEDDRIITKEWLTSDKHRRCLVAGLQTPVCRVLMIHSGPPQRSTECKSVRAHPKAWSFCLSCSIDYLFFCSGSSGFWYPGRRLRVPLLWGSDNDTKP